MVIISRTFIQWYIGEPMPVYFYRNVSYNITSIILILYHLYYNIT